MQCIERDPLSTDIHARDTIQPAELALQQPGPLQASSAATGVLPSQPRPLQAELEVLLASLRVAPTDPEGWNRLVRLAEATGDTVRIKEAYEGLLLAYPRTVEAQIAYVNRFINPDQYRFAEELFKRFLPSSPHVPLWRLYLSYVIRVNSGTHAQETICNAYECALKRIGHDKDSGDIWIDYIRLIEQTKATALDEKDKVDRLRDVYQRAVQIPLENVQQIWYEYERFEESVDRGRARTFMAQYSPSNMQARAVLRKVQKHVRATTPKLAPHPLFIWLPTQPTFDGADRSLVGAWKTYLRWEESNPLQIENTDNLTLVARIRGVYRKALVRMRFFPEVWHMAYEWTVKATTKAQAFKILEEGISANPTSFVLNFAYAEALELDGADNYSAVHRVFTTLLSGLRARLEARQTFSRNSGVAAGGDNQGQNKWPDTVQQVAQGAEGFDAHAVDDGSTSTSEKDFASRRHEYGLAWIMYMRFARRAEGTKSGRETFGKARQDDLIPWQVYEAAAQSEYHSGRDASVATRIFAKGLETFHSEPEYVLRYLKFLLSINDDKNAGALFARVIKTFSPDQARPIWDFWVGHHALYSDISTVLAIGRDLAETYPKEYPLKRLAQRHVYDGTDAIASRDLGFAYVLHNATSQGENNNRLPAQLQPQSGSGMPAPLEAISLKRSASCDRESGQKRQNTYGGQCNASIVDHRPRGRYNPGNGRFLAVGAQSRNDAKFAGPSHSRGDRRGAPPHERSQSLGERFKVPDALNGFIAALPPASSFHGPNVRADGLMQVLREVVIPSYTSLPRAQSPTGPPHMQPQS